MDKIKELQEKQAAELKELAEKFLAPAQEKLEKTKKKYEEALAELELLEAQLGLKKANVELEKRARGTKATSFTFVMTPEKIGTGQKAAILKLIETAKTISREELLKLMEPMVTKMSRTALLSYYTPELVKSGAITTA